MAGEVNVGDALSHTPLYAIGAGLAIGLAALGGAIGQGKIGAAAVDGIARNPQSQKVMFVPMILALVLIESLVIYALVIAFQLAGVLAPYWAFKKTSSHIKFIPLLFAGISCGCLIWFFKA